MVSLHRVKWIEWFEMWQPIVGAMKRMKTVINNKSTATTKNKVYLLLFDAHFANYLCSYENSMDISECRRKYYTQNLFRRVIILGQIFNTSMSTKAKKKIEFFLLDFLQWFFSFNIWLRTFVFSFSSFNEFKWDFTRWILRNCSSNWSLWPNQMSWNDIKDVIWSKIIPHVHLFMNGKIMIRYLYQVTESNTFFYTLTLHTVSSLDKQNKQNLIFMMKFFFITFIA